LLGEVAMSRLAQNRIAVFGAVGNFCKFAVKMMIGYGE
jgi:hypothetical protein